MRQDKISMQNLKRTLAVALAAEFGVLPLRYCPRRVHLNRQNHRHKRPRKTIFPKSLWKT